MRLGFTGTRNEPTDIQKRWFAEVYAFNCNPTEFHHGACVGADKYAHDVAVAWNLRGGQAHITIHPPIYTNHMMELPAGIDPHITVLPPHDYLERNQHIVNASDAIIALPKGPEEVRSGTWSTVRYAVKTGVPVTICYPNGYIEIIKEAA